ncbi:hypothetical protein [Brevundimonas sp. A19_0]|uniref:hypothetical protein n=1 Tax=Brevundimonas sp. A19_0 TaxID=2821087 RepID=UPI001ADA383B|nr:hypothetical protein [Brevundimonas sp. A19_0]MBO9502053.1 hypothetical protein [Brevundimonas sp. A19_0]
MTAPAYAKRVIYLNGEDTGLSAWKPSQAVDTLLHVLHRRGRHTVTRQMLADSYRTSKGRVDFTLEPEQQEAGS